MLTPREIVDSYYRAVDGSTHDHAGFAVRDSYIEAIASLFSEAAVYHRTNQDLPTDHYVGLSDIRNFFKNHRKLVGRHSIESFEESFNEGGTCQINTQGFFDGRAYIGHEDYQYPIRLSFSDVWYIGSDGKILERRSTIAPVLIANTSRHSSAGSLEI